jgi:hypothetical protein
VAANKRKNLLARIVTPGGDDPLLLRLVAPEVIRTGVAATGIALVGQGGAGGYAYSILTGSAYGGLPPGLTLNANGTITGTPTTTGTFSFVAQVQDSASSIYTATFSLRILSRMFRKHKAIRNGEVGIPYVFQFKVGGNTGSVTWSLVSGNFPAGLTLDTSTGVLSGTPTADSNGLGGTSYFTVRATDGGSGETLDMPDKIRIYDELVMPSAPRIVIVYIGRYFEHQIEPTGGTGVYQFSIPSGQTMPVGIKFDSRTGLFYGVPAGPPTLSPWDTDIRVGDVFASDLYEYLFVVMRQVNADAPIDGKKYLRRDGDWEEFTGGDGGVASVGGALPDSSGDISVTSPDGSVGISVDSSGALALTAVNTGGSVQSVAGQLPDSSGDVPLVIPSPIQFGAGSRSGSPIPTNNADAGGVVSYTYRIGINWMLEVSPAISSGTFTLDLRVAPSGSWPTNSGDSITSGVGPSITTGVEQSGTTGAWSSDSSGDIVLNPGDAVDCVVVTNTAGVRWYRLTIESTRNF